MTATNAYLVISQNPDNGMDCIDEFGGVVVNASDYQPKGLLDGWFSGWLSESESRYAG